MVEDLGRKKHGAANDTIYIYRGIRLLNLTSLLLTVSLSTHSEQAGRPNAHTAQYIQRRSLLS